MSDTPDKNQQLGQPTPQQKTPQEDSSKKNPAEGGQDAEEDQPGHRRAS